MVKVCTLCKFYIKDRGMVFHPICNTVLIVSQSEICHLSGLSPAELIRRGEEEEVRNHSSSHCDIPSGVHCINVRTCNYFPQLMYVYFCGWFSKSYVQIYNESAAGVWWILHSKRFGKAYANAHHAKKELRKLLMYTLYIYQIVSITPINLTLTYICLSFITNWL